MRMSPGRKLACSARPTCRHRATSSACSAPSIPRPSLRGRLVVLMCASPSSRGRRAPATRRCRDTQTTGGEVDRLASPRRARAHSTAASCSVRATGAARLTSVVAPARREREARPRRRAIGPAILPQGEYEEFGIEDPRITRIGERYYITYVAVSRHGAATALMSTTDFRDVRAPRHHLPAGEQGRGAASRSASAATTSPSIGPCAPCRSRGPRCGSRGRRTSCTGASTRRCIAGSAAWETGRVGAGAPPVRTPRGWLEIYHGNRRPTRRATSAPTAPAPCCSIATNPGHIAQLAPQPVLEPTEPYEHDGICARMWCFPAAIVEVERPHSGILRCGRRIDGRGGNHLGQPVDGLRFVNEECR